MKILLKHRIVYKLCGLIILCFLFSGYKTTAPPKIEDKDVAEYFKKLYNKLDISEVVTTNPNGNYKGRYGQVVIYNNSGSYSLMTCTSSPSGTVWASFSGPGSSGYITIQDEGSGLTQRSTVNFIGSPITCIDNGGSSRTDCTVTPTVPGGLNTQVQFNDSGAFGGDAGLVYEKTTDALTVNGDLLVDTNTFKVNSTTNNVGIGTLTPGAALEIKGSVDQLQETIKANNGQLSNIFSITKSDGTNIATAGIGAIEISTGAVFDHLVGIGTTNPRMQFHINQIAGSTYKGMLFTGEEFDTTRSPKTNANGIRMGMGVNITGNHQLWQGDDLAWGSSTLDLFRYQTGGTGWAGLDAISGDGQQRGVAIIGTDTTAAGVGFDALTPNPINYTGKLTIYTYNETTPDLVLKRVGTAGDYFQVEGLDAINSNGNLGVGYTSPGTKLAVNGNVGIGVSTTTAQLQVSASGSNPIIIFGDGVGNVFQRINAGTTTNQGAILFNEGATQDWFLGKQNDTSFLLYDYIAARTVINAISNGNLFLMPTTGNIGVGVTATSGKFTVNGNVGVGTTTPASTLEVNGTADQIQTTIKGNSAQSNKIFIIKTSLNTEIASAGVGSFQISSNAIMIATAGIGTLNPRSRLSVNGHQQFLGTTPTIYGCGNGASIVGNDSVGKITIGTTGISSCGLRFDNTWTNIPNCYANDETNILLVKTVPVTTSAVFSVSTTFDSDVIAYFCVGRE